MRIGTRLASLAGGARCAECARPGPMLCTACARRAVPAGEGRCPDAVDRVIARWAYDGVPRALVLDLKLRHVRGAAEPLAHGLVDLVRRSGCAAEVLTWVPGRPRENRVRGFDHAELIAREVSRHLGLPCVPALTRRLDVADQTGLSRAERRVNLAGAFGSRPVAGWVGVVDDVVTSGATASVCAQSLKAAGAAGVELLVACRA